MNPSEKIRFHCPGCDHPVAAPATKAGARMRCPKCKGAVTVPDAPASTPSPVSAAPSAPVPALTPNEESPASAPVQEKEKVSHPGPGMLLRGEWLLFRCPDCNTWTKVKSAHFNRNVACGVCKTEFFLELES